MRFDANRFKRDICDIISEIPYGKVLTYGDVAFLAGMPNHSRHVGHVLHTMPESSKLPCHRIVNSQGRTAPNWKEQKYKLETEGVIFKDNGRVDMNQSLWKYQDTLILK